MNKSVTINFNIFLADIAIQAISITYEKWDAYFKDLCGRNVAGFFTRTKGSKK